MKNVYPVWRIHLRFKWIKLIFILNKLTFFNFYSFCYFRIDMLLKKKIKMDFQSNILFTIFYDFYLAYGK